MRKRKLYSLLIALSPEDLTGLKHYLTSPLFNSSKTLASFLALWRRKLLNDPEGEEMSAEQFVKGTSFTVARLDKLCSQLYQKVMDFLALREFQEDELTRQELFLKALERREVGIAEFSRQYERLAGQLAKMPDSVARRLQVLKLRWMMAEATTQARETQTLWKEDFRDLHQLTDDYYHLQKLKLASASANLKHVFNQDHPDPAASFMEQLRDRHTQEGLDSLLSAYYLIAEMFSAEEGGEYFKRLLSLLDQNSSQFDKAEAQELYSYTLNFCIRKENEGQSSYAVHTASLYQKMLDKGFLFENGKLPPSQMKNLVFVNCRTGNLDWVRSFIDTYRDRLTEGTAPYVATYNEAVLAFFKQDYHTAIRLLKEVISQSKDDIFYELGARNYLWRSYFEYRDHLSIEEVDEMYRMYDAFRVFIDRNQKISEAHKNFIREFKRFMVILDREPIAKENLQSLRKEIAAMSSMVNKVWFLEKIDGFLQE